MGIKKAVFFDIDGTLWNYQHYIPDSTRVAIRRLRENGHLALLCSGRARAFIQDEDLLSLGFDGIVCSCGNHIEINEEVVFENYIEEKAAVDVVELVRAYGFKPILEGPKYLYMDDEEFPVGDEFGDILRADIGDFILPINGAGYGKWHMNKFSCDTSVEENRRLECIEKVTKNFDVIEHNPAVCEVIPKGINKATGMLHACELLGVSKEDTFAFGDSENDLEMLRAAGVGVAMGNGSDRAKSEADYITDAFDADGIYNALKHFKLI